MSRIWPVPATTTESRFICWSPKLLDWIGFGKWFLFPTTIEADGCKEPNKKRDQEQVLVSKLPRPRSQIGCGYYIGEFTLLEIQIDFYLLSGRAGYRLQLREAEEAEFRLHAGDKAEEQVVSILRLALQHVPVPHRTRQKIPGVDDGLINGLLKQQWRQTVTQMITQ